MSVPGSVVASQTSNHIADSGDTAQNGGEGTSSGRQGEGVDGGVSDSDEENQGGGSKGGWKTGWDSESDEYSESDLPPPGWNPDAELAQDLDLSKIYEPPSLKFTQTPFTLARSRPRNATTTTTSKLISSNTAEASIAFKAPTTSQARQTSTAGLSKSINIPRPPPAPKSKRRGPVPAKSGRMFEAPDPPQEKKSSFKKWTKAEANGWKDATGKPIPTTKPAATKKAPAAPSIAQILDQAPVKGKDGKGKVKGKGKVVAKVIGDEVEEPEVDNVVPKGRKKAAPSKKKGEDDAMEGTKKRKTTKSVRIIEGEEEEEEEPVPKPAAKARGKRKVVESDDDQPGPSRKKKAAEIQSKGKGKGRGAAGEDGITFTRLPAGAATNTDYPIIDALEKQRSLPIKKPAAQRKTKTQPVKVDSPPLSEKDKAAFDFFSSLKNPTPGNKLPLDRLIPPSTTAQKSKAQEQGNEDGESINSDVSYAGARVDIGGVGNEEEGKGALMSRYFSQQTTRGKSLPNSGPTLVPTPPAESSTLDPPTITQLTRSPAPNSPGLNQGNTIPADSSSALPYSSPLEKRQVRRQDSQLVHPQPVRAAVPALPNAEKYERLKEIAEQKGREAEAKGNSSTAPDLTSAMRKGYTPTQPMSVSRNPRRGKSPQSQIESRYRSQPREATRPDFSHDNFRPPAWHKNHSSAKGEEDHVWSTLDTKSKKGNPSSFVDRLVNGNGNSRASTTGASMYSSGTTTSNITKRSNLFTPTAPAPPPPEITVPIPKFRMKTSTNGGIPYGAQASASQDQVDPYSRQAGSTSYVINGSSPAEETLCGKHGVYKVNKRAATGGYEERPRYMPAMVVPLDQGGKNGWGDNKGEDRLDKWRNPHSRSRGTSASWQASDNHEGSGSSGHRIKEIVPRVQADYGDSYHPHSQPHRQIGFNGHRYHDNHKDHPVDNAGSFHANLPAHAQPKSRLDIPMATFIGSGSSRSNQRSDGSADHRNDMQHTGQMGNGVRSASEVHCGGMGNGRMYGNARQDW